MLGLRMVWLKTLGGAVRSITNIYSLIQPHEKLKNLASLSFGIDEY